MYADTTVNNLQATLPLISQLSGQQQEVAQKLKDDWRFFVAQTEKSDPKKVFTFKKTRISAGKRGRGTLISVFNGAVRRPFNGTAGYEYSGQSHPGGPCAAPRKAESGTTQGPHAI